MLMNENGSVLVSLFGDSPRMKIIDYLLEFPTNEFTLSELVDEIGMSKTTAPKILDDFKGKGMIVKTEKIGKSQPYKINLRNPVIQLMQNVAHIASDRIAEQQAARKNINRILRNARVSSRAVLLMRQQLLEQELQYTRTELEAIPTQ